jgi:hypothetical protein
MTTLAGLSGGSRGIGLESDLFLDPLPGDT